MNKNESMITKSCGNIFVDLGFPEDEATVMHMRVEVMAHINKRIVENGWKLHDIADQLGLTHLEAGQLLKTDVANFNLDKLVFLAIRIGLRVQLDWR